MSQIRVITTDTHVYTTFYKTIHFKDFYNVDTDRESLIHAQALAFSLSCTDHMPATFQEYLPELKSDSDIFDYLDKKHSIKL